MKNKIIPSVASVDDNLWLKSLETQLNEPTNQNSIKSPRLLSQENIKSYCMTWVLV